MWMNWAQPAAAPLNSVHRDVESGPSPTAKPASSPTSTRPTARHGSSRRHISAVVSKPDYLVLFVIDGGRPDYLKVSHTPNLHALMRRGSVYTNAFAGILESETPSGHATIGTGSPPNKDGILSFAWANSDNNRTTNLFDPNLVQKGGMERIMNAAGAPSIAGLIHASKPNAQVVALSGHKYYAADAIGGPDADAIIYYQGTPDGKYAPVSTVGHSPPRSLLRDPSLTLPTTHLPTGAEDHLTMHLAEKTVHAIHPTALLVNLPEFDWPLGHVWGADRDRKAVVKLMRGFDRDLGTLEAEYRKAGILDRTLFVVTADHGFAPIYHQVTKDVLQAAVAKTGAKIISDTYHTAAYMWLDDPSKASAAAGQIALLGNPYIQSVYFKEHTSSGYDYVRASGPQGFRAAGMEAANQYLLHTFDGVRGPDVVTFFTETTASLPGGEANWKGDHGGADWESQHVPLVFSGPGVNSGVRSEPVRLQDIAPTALSLMGISPTGMAGIPLADAIKHPGRGAVARQRELTKTLQPVVASLKTEAAREVAAGR
jgi:arylsulfatase A-like enzyme